MAYNGDLKWADLAALAAAGSGTLVNAVMHGQELFQKWTSFAAGRDNATIAAALSLTSGQTITEAQVADLAACFQAFYELNACASNQPIAQGDRLFSMRKFE